MSDTIKDNLPIEGYMAYSKVFAMFHKYAPDDAFVISSEHDIIYSCSVSPDDMQNEDVETIKALGWHWSEDYDCWACFT